MPKRKTKRRRSTGFFILPGWEKLGDGPRIPRWPSADDPRRVKVNIHTWIGTAAIGAEHYHVDVEIEQQQYWYDDENAWAKISEDFQGAPYNLRATVQTRKQAEEIAHKFVQIIAADDSQLWRFDQIEDEDE